MRIEEVDRERFLMKVAEIRYRNQDIREAHEFGCKNIRDCYERADRHFARYFVGYEDETPVLTVMLQLNRYIVFFISKDVEKPIRLVRGLRRFARKMTRHCAPIITKTANWYDQAIRLNKLVGFVPWVIRDGYSLWVFGSDLEERRRLP